MNQGASILKTTSRNYTDMAEEYRNHKNFQRPKLEQFEQKIYKVVCDNNLKCKVNIHDLMV